MSLSRFSLIPLLAVLGAAPLGCHAHVYTEPEPYSVTAVTSAPYGVEAAPYVYYEGRPTYYHGGRWWYRSGPSWYYYHQEPPALQRQRPYVQQAPPAYRGPAPYRQPYNQPPASAPPATRVQ
jgi:hypothetical protein